MQLVDFLINVHPQLGPDQRTELEADINHVDGVVSACFSPDHPHMLTVAYNSDVVTSGAVLQHVREKGIEADKIGL